MKLVQRKAQSDIYEIGRYIPDSKKKSGFRYTRKQPSEELEDRVLVKKGGLYWAWGLWGDKHLSISVEQPTRSDMTKSLFKKVLFDYEDYIHGLTIESFLTEKNHIIHDLKLLADKQEVKRMNLPTHLQDKHVGILLKKREELVIDYIKEIERASQNNSLPKRIEL